MYQIRLLMIIGEIEISRQKGKRFNLYCNK